MTSYPHLNEIYISQRLGSRLSGIETHRITTISAPMGYGKTTAVKWWRKQLLKRAPGVVILKQNIMSDSLTEFWQGFCHKLKKHNPRLAEQMQELGCPQDQRTMATLMELVEDAAEVSDTPIFLILDDVHLLPAANLVAFLRFFADTAPEHIHLVLLSRRAIFQGPERVRLGSHLYEIEAPDLRLTGEEIIQYARTCGLPLSPDEAERLTGFSEGWIAFTYLLFKQFVQTGKWQYHTTDISKLIDQVMLEPLSQRQKSLLTYCSIVEEFTAAQAACLDGGSDAEELLEALHSANGFLSRGDDGVYRCHNLLRQNTERRFTALPQTEQRAVWERLGDWHSEQGEYLPAMDAYYKAQAWEKLLGALEQDGGSSLFVENKDQVKAWYEACPEDVLCAHPGAVLLLALECFSVGNIPDMLRFNEMLTEIVEKHPALSKQERAGYMGDSQILLGFLTFNDISAMSEFHRRACALLNRPTRLVNLNSPWTFGAPSILTMYHSKSGDLDKENEEMVACMPHYYQVSDGHGNGAEYAMLAETAYMRGQMADAEINYWMALRAAQRKKQYSVQVVAEFTAMRSDLMAGKYRQVEERLETLRQTLKDNHQFALFDTVDLCQGWLYALLGQIEDIPQWLMEASAPETVMPFVAPTLLTIQNQALLAAGEYAQLVAQGGEYAAMFEESKMTLCSIYLHIHLAAALEKLGRRDQALAELQTALALALPDGIRMPFAENGEYIWALLPLTELPADERNTLLALCEKFQTAKENILRSCFTRSPDFGLTERELEIARLAAQRKTIKEIATALYLSENTVKFHLKHTYEKLELTGTSQNKRAALEKILSSK